MNHRMVALAIACLIVPALLFAQGTSPIKVAGISISPASVAAGGRVTITAKLQNTATRTYGCTGPNFNAAVYVFKADQYTTVNQVFATTQSTTPFTAGETRSVTFPTPWTVPAGNVETYHILVWSPLCAPDEFGQTGVLKLRRSCTYSAPTLVLVNPALRVPRLPIH